MDDTTAIHAVLAILSNDDGACDRLDRLYDLLDDRLDTIDNLAVGSFLADMVRGYLTCAAWAERAPFEGFICPGCYKRQPDDLRPNGFGMFLCPHCRLVYDEALPDPECADDDEARFLDVYPDLDLAWAPEAQRQALADCREFFLQNATDCMAVWSLHARTGGDDGEAWAAVGRDFHLTRNGHGTGFWDRGHGVVGDRLTDAARPWGETSIWLDDDAELHFAHEEP